MLENNIVIKSEDAHCTIIYRRYALTVPYLLDTVGSLSNDDDDDDDDAEDDAWLKKEFIFYKRNRPFARSGHMVRN